MQSLGKNRVDRRVPRRYVEKIYFTYTSTDLKTSISCATMKKGKGHLWFEGEHLVCSGGGDTALVYKDIAKSDRKRFTEDCRKMDVTLKRFASGAMARTSEKIAPCGTQTM